RPSPQGGGADRVAHRQRPLGTPLVVELEAGARLHLALARAPGDLRAGFARVMPPQRIRPSRPAGARPLRPTKANPPSPPRGRPPSPTPPDTAPRRPTDPWRTSPFPSYGARRRRSTRSRPVTARGNPAAAVSSSPPRAPGATSICTGGRGTGPRPWRPS